MKTIINYFLRRKVQALVNAYQDRNRLDIALYVKRHAENDFFGGWQEDDLMLLNKYKPASLPFPNKGEIVDWLGVRTSASYHSWLPLPFEGYLLNSNLPVPDDMVHAATIEYVSLLMSIEGALKSGAQGFTAVELGASYAPWAIATGVLAERHGFPQINLLAVEASENMVPRILEHASRNGLLNKQNIKLQPIHGAISVKDGNVYFPRVNVVSDNGAQITYEPKDKDYRGMDVDHDFVKSYSLKSLLSEFNRVDFMHMDVQGAEADLLTDEVFLEVLDSKVALLFLATQSRLIEGIALDRLSKLGWRLFRERPTTYLQNERTTDINGWTLRDGGQIWQNPIFDRALAS